MASSNVNVTVSIKALRQVQRLIEHHGKWKKALEDIELGRQEVVTSRGIYWADGYVAGLAQALEFLNDIPRDVANCEGEG